MGTYDTFKTSEKHEIEGITLDLDDAGKFKLKRAGGRNVQFIKQFSSRTRPYRRQIQTDTMNEAKARQIMAEVFASTVVLGWENVTGPDGEPLLFSYANCVKLLTDLPELFSEIQATAQDAALFRETVREEDAKN
jgi:hypothetical protein